MVISAALTLMRKKSLSLRIDTARSIKTAKRPLKPYQPTRPLSSLYSNTKLESSLKLKKQSRPSPSTLTKLKTP
jgi:hypothetical protein